MKHLESQGLNRLEQVEHATRACVSVRGGGLDVNVGPEVCGQGDQLLPRAIGGRRDGLLQSQSAGPPELLSHHG